MASATFTWKLKASEQYGKLFLTWETDAPFRAQQDQIFVYPEGTTSFPANPQDANVDWTWANPGNIPWATGKDWGKNWYCAYVAQTPEGGTYEYTYVIQLKTKE